MSISISGKQHYSSHLIVIFTRLHWSFVIWFIVLIFGPWCAAHLGNNSNNIETQVFTWQKNFSLGSSETSRRMG
ncbi:hypothetical protein MKW98_016929 [Papaver atlanticum]|uniref:Uncharacterized protein n=1 Tax=Papaver atlanticum TaxID=357466 RepID=A0AAD4TK23_9MAGN|nr:hypothetical protein MKW98_016929 [Papaver atlanticum]